MHPPRKIDVKYLHQLISAFRIVASPHGREEGRYVNIRANDGVQHPLETQVRNALEAGGERVDAGDADGAGGGHALAGEETEEGGFASAVC